MKKIMSLIWILFSLNLNAAIVAGNFTKIDTQKKTHLIIVGTGDQLGELFWLSANTKAKLLLNLYPNDQIVFAATDDDRDFIKKSSFKIILESSAQLKEGVIETIVDKVAEIASIDIYSHSNFVQGVILDKTRISSQTLSEKSLLWEKIKPKLRSNSYVMIHGCNTGAKMAPSLSLQLDVPVFGALTSSDFQYVYTNKKWSHDYEVKELKKSLDKRIRMKPDNYPYRGHWGSWDAGGFPSYKVFCGDLDQESCASGALEALFSFPSVLDPRAIITTNDFKENLFDFLCPFTERNDVFNECRKHLELSLFSNDEDFYSPFRGKTLNCSLKRCEAHFQCSVIQILTNPGSCKLVSENENKSDAFVREFKFFMNAYQLKISSDKWP